MNTINLTVGTETLCGGCFTHEEWLMGKTAKQIAAELGILPYRMEQGLYIVWAVVFPRIDEFDLGGYAKFSTDKFVDYPGQHQPHVWSEQRFEETYANGKRMNVSIADAKKAWYEEMKRSKLVKVIPAVGGAPDEKYPPGNKAPQILLKNRIPCQVVGFIKDNEVFRGVFGRTV